MQPRSVGLLAALLLLGNGGASAEWVWGRTSKAVKTAPAQPTEPAAAPVEEVTADEEGFVAFTEPPDTLPQAKVVQGTSGDFVAESALDSSRGGKAIDSETYDEIYNDPEVQAALEAGNDTQARSFIRNKLCFLGLVDCDDDLPPPPRYPVNSHYSPPKPSYGPPQSSYGAPKPAYHPPPKGGYGPPKGAYPAPINSHYTPPKAHHDIHRDGPVRHGGHDSHDSHNSHDDHVTHIHHGDHDSHGKDSHVTVSHAPIQPAPVQEHHHTHHHTHIEPGRPGKAIDVSLPVYPPTYTPLLAGVNRGPELGIASINSGAFVNSNLGPGVTKIANRPVSGGLGGGAGLTNPTLAGGFGGGGAASLGRPASGLGSLYYRENCVCVPRYACDAVDVVSARAGRGTVDLSVISPRANFRNGSALARVAKSLDGDEILAQVKAVISEEKQDVSAAASGSETVSRTRRATLTKPQETEARQLSRLSSQPTPEVPEGRQLVTDAQGRQLGYQPNHRGCFHTDVCCRNPIPIGSQGRQQPGSCGVGRTDAVNGRIKNYDVREGETVFGEFPWHVAILKKEGADNVYVCAGSLIGTEYILTAAHCVKSYDPYALRIRLGEWDVNHETEFYPHVEKDVSGIYIHPEFYGGNLHNDIAILKLASPVDTVYNLHVGPVCIPPQYADFTNQRCWTSGWGKDAFGDFGNFQNVLKKVSVPVVGNYDCEQKLKRTRLGYDFQLHSGFLCAGGEEGKDACKGDGGGPLVCEQAGSYYLAGIVSWGVGCGQRDVPGVYVKVNEYLPWIQSITAYRPYTGIQARSRKRAEGIEAEDYIEVIKE
ncbi:uncharacterized protein LOC119102112 [Pollicipes pollicipes]|uniref:uncharacterized protein LOC119102112 n=1 Tax=Pollicipes pollicipes TaxID=41117 RepID=UPI001884917A|nr:uncharacterized protein LOC119102112 [Pollicipes pollicipes]